VTESIPYADNSFDVVILNMAAHDLSDLAKGFRNLHRVLKPGSKFLMTIANPYYGFPVGVWKRGVIGRLLNKFPKLQLRPYHFFARQKNQLHAWSGELSSYFYPLSEYLDQALASGFRLQVFRDLENPTDSDKYDARFRLYRWPMILLLVFEKGGK
jgi:SAM-dependent methyltransferase